MIWNKMTPINHIEIWEQRYHDRTALVAKWKVQEYNRVTFKSNSRPGNYFIKGSVIRKYPTETKVSKQGNNFEVYVVPLDEFEPLEYREEVVAKALAVFDE